MPAPIIDEWSKTIQNFLFGPRCVLCHDDAPLSRELCDGCLADLPWLTHSCRYCALPLPPHSPTECCRACRHRPRFDHSVGAFGYHEPIRWLVGGLKFRSRLGHARLLGDLLAQRIVSADVPRPEALIPVPLHKAGYRRRGFNQAERLGLRLARQLDRPLETGMIARNRDTSPQRALPAAQRAANVRGAFSCLRPLPYRHVAVVDDVVTTTQTATAVAECLRAAGAQRVDLYCVARA